MLPNLKGENMINSRNMERARAHSVLIEALDDESPSFNQEMPMQRKQQLPPLKLKNLNRDNSISKLTNKSPLQIRVNDSLDQGRSRNSKSVARTYKNM